MVSFREWLREAEEAKNSGKEETLEYKEYFQKMLDKYEVKSPAELSKEDKIKFFDEIEAGWKSEDEKEVEEVNESDESKLLIKLEDGDMKIVSKPVDSDNFEHTVSYNGIKTIFVTNNSYEAVSFKGQALDALTLFNYVIQQFYIDGTVKSK